MGLEYDTHIQYLKGVGPKLGDVLRRRGVATVGQLLEWFPRTYEDRRRARNINTLADGQIVSLKARIRNVRSIPMGRSHRKIYEIMLSDVSGSISCKFFRTPYKGYFERFTPHQEVRVSGKVILYRGRLEFHHPDIQPLYDSDEEATDQLIPLYTDTDGLSPHKIRKLMGVAIGELIHKDIVPEAFPSWLREKYQLLRRAEALRQIHIPPQESVDAFLNFRSPAQRRIIFEEFFWIELSMALEKMGLQREAAPAFAMMDGLVERLEKILPFRLTERLPETLRPVR